MVTIKEKYEKMYNSMLTTNDASWYVKKAMANKMRYERVSSVTGVPWQIIACIHARESSFNFKACLHNGQPWNKVTTIVPKGRGPFLSWEEAAIDAIKYDKLDVVKDWSIGNALDKLERYNGLGYRKMGVPSPYLWSYSDHYKKGKYSSDGKYDPNLIDKQIGCAVLLKELNYFIDKAA